MKSSPQPESTEAELVPSIAGHDAFPGSRHTRLIIFAIGFGAICGATFFVGAAPVRTYGHDLFVFLDGGWRVLQGQRPHVDFYTGTGALMYLIMAAGLTLAHGSAAGIGYASGMAGLVVGIWSYVLARRMRAVPALLVSFFLTLLAVAPHVIGELPVMFTHAMLYNRYGYALLGLLIIAEFQERTNERTNEAAGAISTGAVCGLALFLKVSYFYMGVFLIAVASIFWGVSRRRMLMIAGGFLAVSLAMLAYLQFQAGAVWSDLAVVTAARSENIVQTTVLKKLAANFDELVRLLLFALVVACCQDGWKSVQTSTVLRYGMVAVAVFLASIALLATNWQSSGLPLNSVLAVVLFDRIMRNREAFRVIHSPPVRFAAYGGLVLWMLLILAPPFASDLASVVFAAKATAAKTAETDYSFDAPVLHRLRVFGTEPTGRPVNGADLVDYVNDGIHILRQNSSSTERVLCLDFANPFSYALQRPPSKGGYTGLQYLSNFTDRHKPSANWLLGGADVILIPKRPASTASEFQGLLRNYGGFVYRNYRLDAESRLWRLYRRLGDAQIQASLRTQID